LQHAFLPPKTRTSVGSKVLSIIPRMTSLGVGRIERVPLREVWPHEAFDFTVWLEKNIDLLNDYLAPPIEPDSVSRETAAGAFAVDLVAEDADGEIVIVENQLERSNHDHLGKLVTYAAALSAKTVVWIVAEPRDEHVRAISWLNDARLAAFWLFKIEAIRIGDSLPAPSLTKIVGPAEDVAIIRAGSPQGDLRDRTRRAFFGQLLEHAGERTKLHVGVKAGGHPWLGHRVGAVSWVYGVRTNGTRVMLYIDRGADHGEENDAIYRSLLSHKDAIEHSFGGPLTWEAKENNRSRTICRDLEMGGWADVNTWPIAIETTVTAMIALEKALTPYLQEALEAGDAVALSVAVGDEDQGDAEEGPVSL
jgi:hypothetical protein